MAERYLVSPASRRGLLASALALVLPMTPSGTMAEPAAVTVFAAASLSEAMQGASELFARQGGGKVRFSFAASSTLAKQIEAGAQAQIFLSADQHWMDYLDKRGLLEPGTRRATIANRLVLVVPADRAVTFDPGSASAWLANLPTGRIATGDPAHVPAGRYAQQALAKLGLWSQIEPRLARADNVRNALALVERGEAAAGIVYATDAAISQRIRIAGRFPEAAHEPIVYPMAMLRGGGQGGAQSAERGEARRLYDFLLGSDARAFFNRLGFLPPP